MEAPTSKRPYSHTAARWRCNRPTIVTRTVPARECGHEVLVTVAVEPGEIPEDAAEREAPSLCSECVA